MYHVSRLSTGEYGVFSEENGCLLAHHWRKKDARRHMARIIKQGRKRSRNHG